MFRDSVCDRLSNVEVDWRSVYRGTWYSIHLGSEYLRHCGEPICQLGPFPVEGVYNSVVRCRSRRLLVNLASPDFTFISYLQALTLSYFSSAIRILALKSAWMKSKVFPLALKRVSLNYTTAVTTRCILEKYYGVIEPTLTIEGSNFQYIVSRFNIKARVFVTIRSRFCDVFVPMDVPASFLFAPITKCVVWTWGLTEFPFCCSSELIFRYKFITSFIVMETFPGRPSCPCAT